MTEAGTVAAALLLETTTVEPAVGAGPLSVTVPVEDAPPIKELGLTATEETPGEFTVRVAIFETAPRVEVIVTLAETETAVVPIENVADDLPEAIVTETGTVADGLLLNNETTMPEGPAGPVRVTVPMEGLPPTTAAGFNERAESVATVTVRFAVCVTVPALAEMVTDVDVETAAVEMVNVAERAPAAIVTVAGTVAAALLLESETDVPPLPAGPFSVTVPFDALPPVTDAGFKAKDARVAAFTVRDAVSDEDPSFAVIVTAVWAETAPVVTVNVAVVCPAATVTEPCTTAAALLLDSETADPPVGATPVSFTVPVEEAPPNTDVGFRESDEIAGGLTVKVALFETVPTVAVITALT